MLFYIIIDISYFVVFFKFLNTVFLKTVCNKELTERSNPVYKVLEDNYTVRSVEDDWDRDYKCFTQAVTHSPPVILRLDRRTESQELQAGQTCHTLAS